MLCDRVAILNLGRMQGCGELKEMLGMGINSTEVLLESPRPELLDELKPFCGYAVRTGERVRVEIPKESDLPAVLGKVLQSGGKIVSVNPVKMSLEDYFLAKVAKDNRKSADQELVAEAKGGR